MNEVPATPRPIRLKCRYDGQTRLVVLPVSVPPAADFLALHKQLCFDYGFEVGMLN